jgi:probable O-glycosylation ligase (exosortase A-associated)
VESRGHASVSSRGARVAPAPIGPGALPLFLTLAYAALEYGRPQDAIPGLEYARLSLLTSGLLGAMVFQWARRVPWFHPQLAIYGAILCFMAAWVPFATNNFWAFKTTWVLLQTYLFTVSLATFVNSAERLRAFALIWIASGFFQAIWGTLHAGRGTGYFNGDENDFALTMCLILPFTLLSWGHLERVWQKLLCAITAVACVVGVVASSSRGGFVGLVATCGLMVLLHPKRLRFAALGAAAVVLLAALAGPAYWDEMATIFDEGGTKQDRYDLWSVAWSAYTHNPVLGVGPGNINWVIQDYQHFEPGARSDNGRAVHSFYFTLLAELGSAGVILYALLLAYNARDLRRIIRARALAQGPALDGYARAVACSIVAYLACGAFLTVNWYPHLYFLTGLTVALERVRASAPRRSESAAAPAPALMPAAALPVAGG